MDVWDLLCAIGLCTVGVGVWMIYPPVALIVVGAAIMVASIRAAPAKPRTAHNTDEG